MLCLQAAIGRKFAHIFLSFIFLQFQPFFPYTYVLGAYLCTLHRVSRKQRHELWSLLKQMQTDFHQFFTDRFFSRKLLIQISTICQLHCYTVLQYSKVHSNQQTVSDANVRETLLWMSEQEFKDSGLLYKMLFILISTSLVRPRYYIAWKLSTSTHFCFICFLFIHRRHC